jgi:hypothetical protein
MKMIQHIKDFSFCRADVSVPVVACISKPKENISLAVLSTLRALVLETSSPYHL